MRNNNKSGIREQKNECHGFTFKDHNWKLNGIMGRGHNRSWECKVLWNKTFYYHIGKKIYWTFWTWIIIRYNVFSRVNIGLKVKGMIFKRMLK